MSRPMPPHSDAAHAAIGCELVRLSLPHHPATDRPELEHDLDDVIGHLRRVSRRLVAAADDLNRAVRPPTQDRRHRTASTQRRRR